MINPKAATVVALLILGIIVWFLNYQRSEFDTPNVFHLSPEAVSIGAMRSDHCNGAPAGRIAFVSRGEHVIRRILDSYDPGSVIINGQGDGTRSPSLSFFNHAEAIGRGLLIPRISAASFSRIRGSTNRQRFEDHRSRKSASGRNPVFGSIW